MTACAGALADNLPAQPVRRDRANQHIGIEDNPQEMSLKTSSSV